MAVSSISARGAGPKPSVLTLNDAHDDVCVVNDLATAIEMMAMDIGGNQRDAFIRVAQAIKSNAALAKNRIASVATSMKESGE